VAKSMLMGDEAGTMFAWIARVQAGDGPHAELARQVLVALLFAHLLAAGAHAGPPHASRRPPRNSGLRRQRLPHRESLSGRRPRG
jgi:hypothetical protein